MNEVTTIAVPTAALGDDAPGLSVPVREGRPVVTLAPGWEHRPPAEGWLPLIAAVSRGVPPLRGPLPAGLPARLAEAVAEAAIRVAHPAVAAPFPQSSALKPSHWPLGGVTWLSGAAARIGRKFRLEGAEWLAPPEAVLERRLPPPAALDGELALLQRHLADGWARLGDVLPATERSGKPWARRTRAFRDLTGAVPRRLRRALAAQRADAAAQLARYRALVRPGGRWLMDVEPWPPPCWEARVRVLLDDWGRRPDADWARHLVVIEGGEVRSMTHSP